MVGHNSYVGFHFNSLYYMSCHTLSLFVCVFVYQLYFVKTVLFNHCTLVYMFHNRKYAVFVVVLMDRLLLNLLCLVLDSGDDDEKLDSRVKATGGSEETMEEVSKFIFIFMYFMICVCLFGDTYLSIPMSLNE